MMPYESNKIVSRAFETRAALHSALIVLLHDEMQTHKPYPYAVLLSGGSTPKPVYDQIAKMLNTVSDNLHLAYTDERYVAYDSPESNYNMSLPMVLASGLATDKVFRVQTEVAFEESAARYHDDLANFLFKGGKITLGLLGLGTDGHTCSLFNDIDLERSKNRLAAPIYRDVPPNRITVTPELLNQVEQIVFVAAGQDKTEMIELMQKSPETLTAGKAVADCKSIQLWYSLD